MRQGFSLIELMIVLFIVGTLATIAYPSYQKYITRAHRTDGQSALLNLAIRMEHYFSQNNTYNTATLAAGKTTDVLNCSQSPQGWYTLSILKASDSRYILQATPVGKQAHADQLCQSLTLNSEGKKGISNGPAGAPTGEVGQCW